MVSECKICGAETSRHRQYCPDCRMEKREEEKEEKRRECEICGRTIRSGRKYCYEHRNSRDTKTVENYDYEDLEDNEDSNEETPTDSESEVDEDNEINQDNSYQTNKNRKNYGKSIFLISLLIIGLIVIFTFSGNETINSDKLNPIIPPTNESCQYKEKQETGKMNSILYDTNGEQYINPIEFLDFASSQYKGQGFDYDFYCNTDFSVRNKISKEISIDLNYQVNTDGVITNKNISLNILPLSSQAVTERFSSDSRYLSCSIDSSKVSYTFKGVKYQNPLSFSNFITGKSYNVGGPCNCDTGFSIKNNLDKEISFNLFYKSVIGSITYDRTKDLTLAPFASETISEKLSDSCWAECSIDKDSVSYNFYSNTDVFARTEAETIDVCKICNGKNCLNDNQNCSLNTQCGSGICNIAGYCGKSKVVECSSGLKNCNNESCLAPAVKEVGQPYLCEFECKEGFGKDGTCTHTFTGNFLRFLFILFSAIVLLSIIDYFWTNKFIGKKNDEN